MENMNQKKKDRKKEIYTYKLSKLSNFGICMLPYGLAVAM